MKEKENMKLPKNAENAEKKWYYTSEPMPFTGIYTPVLPTPK